MKYHKPAWTWGKALTEYTDSGSHALKLNFHLKIFCGCCQDYDLLPASDESLPSLIQKNSDCCSLLYSAILHPWADSLHFCCVIFWMTSSSSEHSSHILSPDLTAEHRVTLIQQYQWPLMLSLGQGVYWRIALWCCPCSRVYSEG